MNINELIAQPEGRRLEFKGELPTNSDIAKTIVAFANDAGGDIYIGINDKPRQIIGLPEKELTQIEEQISNMIYDRCYPTILPEVSFLSVEEKHLIRICIYRGSMPPYYLKEKGKSLKIEIEVRNFDELEQAMKVGGIDRIMLDNFNIENTKEAVRRINGRFEVESSGGITFDTLRDYAECGVDFISVGALTHSVKSLDMSFKAC